MSQLGSPLQPSANKVLLLGSGELGKELCIELQRLGVEVVAVDSYANAPAMQVAHNSHVINMLDPKALLNLIIEEKPTWVVPELEAIATDALVEVEEMKIARVVPSARATKLTMNREGIRRLVAEELDIPCSRYEFAEDFETFKKAVDKIGLPCVVKPIMSSSGKGQSTIKGLQQLQEAWTYSQSGGRSGGGRVIVEAFVDFDFEITLLTVQHASGTSFCPPIGHLQEDGDYRESWQPQAMSAEALKKAQQIARDVSSALGGWGLFGVELFIKGEEVIFSELSPRPHDTGMVTMISQELSEFALHARAFMGLPVHEITQNVAAAASVPLLAEGKSKDIRFKNIDKALSDPQTQVRLFGKPEVNGRRRLGVTLASSDTTDEARSKARRASEAIEVIL